MSNYYITGANGVLGFELCRHLSQQPDTRVVAVARSAPYFLPGTGVESRIRGDIYGGQWLDPADETATIIHCAGLSNPRTEFDSYEGFFSEHVLPHIRMVEALLARGWRGRLILPSSGGTVYGDPISVPITEDHPTRPKSYYGLQKLMLEQGFGLLAREKRFDLVVLRVSNPYGSSVPKRGQGVIPILIEALLSGETFQVFGDGGALRDYIYIDDFCDAVLRASTAQVADRVTTVNVSSGEGRCVNEIAEMLEQMTGRQLRRVHIPVPHEIRSSVLSIEKASLWLDWRPKTSFEQGLIETAKLLNAYPDRSRP